ncbi:hypothetical protein MTZ49_01690 [Entomomonas sp. E2T0]|uniref:Mor transcription activator family protein n=1 Tax=Entomomonas sp. E2T0 TaxID=2930213 RepID=UPI00222844B6|nr:Mor transcription activator family protein [Entomomonas sp. E2T0]UYZ84320.1 hypothetical protein MTZ49_01690 [Entomomonas sp. E2T0]
MEYHVSEQAKRRNGFFEDLIDGLTRHLIANNINEPEKAAEEIALKLHEEWRGQNLNFPAKPRLYFERLKEQVISEYTGYNKTELLRRHNISESTLYKWMNQKLKEAKKREIDQNGQVMFKL